MTTLTIDRSIKKRTIASENIIFTNSQWFWSLYNYISKIQGLLFYTYTIVNAQEPPVIEALFIILS